MALDELELSPAVGVEIRGLDLRDAITEEDRERLRRLFDERGLLLFRDQTLDAADQLRVCAWFRPVVEPEAWISNVEPGFHPEGVLEWHCDYAFTPHPMLGLSLYAMELAPGAAPTDFANNARALAALDPAIRSQLEGLRVVHVIDSVNGRDNVRIRLEDVGGDAASPVQFPRHARPAVWTHPVTGASLLFVLGQQASHFEGMSARESDPLLDAAFACLYAPSNVYRHDWRIGDFVVWDNLTIQHGRRANPNTVRRSLRRVAMNTVTTLELTADTGFAAAVRANAPA
jgi:taurine dioxygenase